MLFYWTKSKQTYPLTLTISSFYYSIDLISLSHALVNLSGSWRCHDDPYTTYRTYTLSKYLYSSLSAISSHKYCFNSDIRFADISLAAIPKPTPTAICSLNIVQNSIGLNTFIAFIL